MIDIYRKRWGIELFFRHFKQTFGRSQLRRHKAEHTECELHWSLLGLWTMLLYAQTRLTQPPDAPPPGLSVSRILKAFGQTLHEYTSHSTRSQSLTELLQVAVIDTYQPRDKRRRGYPGKKYEPPAPTEANANSQKQLTSHANKKRLPA